MDPLQRAPSNQSAPLVDYDVAATDQALLDAVDAFGGDHGPDIRTSLTPVGRLAGSAETREHWHLANENEPVLRSTDRFGGRVDEVEFHPSWHWPMTQGVGFSGSPRRRGSPRVPSPISSVPPASSPGASPSRDTPARSP